MLLTLMHKLLLHQLLLNVIVANSDLLELKRLTSESLKLQGVKFDKDINQIEFTNDTWGDLILSHRIISLMKVTVKRQIHLYKINSTNPYNNNYDSTILIPIRNLIDTSIISWELVKRSFSVEKVKDLEKRARIYSAIAKINSTTESCFTFWTEGNSSQGIHVEFKEANHSSAFSCGKTPLLADVSNTTYTIELSCFDEASILRMILSLVGLINPIWRYDRDRYVQINWDNIDDRFKYLFHKWNIDFMKSPWWHISLVHNPFDYTSIMMFVQNRYTKVRQNDVLSWEARRKVETKNSELMSKLDVQYITGIICYPGTPAIPGTECSDDDVQCLFYKDQDKCKIDELKIQCGLGCDVCIPVASNVCDDKSNFCNDWKENCQTGAKHFSYMKSYCARTCDACSHGGSSAKWNQVMESITVCDNPKQSTIVVSEEECKAWCLKMKLSHCFWETSRNDGGCFGTVACSRYKNEKSTYRRFDLI